MENEIELGNEVRDNVSGVQGIATARVEYLNGWNQICIQPKSTDGKKVESVYVDADHVVKVGPGVSEP